MKKNLLIAVAASVATLITTTHRKDAEILKLQKRIAHLESYEHFSSNFQVAWEGGVSEGKRRSDLARIRSNANLN